MLHHYCIMRRDLPMGVFAAQLIHAAGESNPEGIHSYAVALWVDDEEELAAKEARLLEHDIPHVAVREPDAPWDNQLMAIGVCPIDRSTNKQLRKIVAGLPLIK